MAGGRRSTVGGTVVCVAAVVLPEPAWLPFQEALPAYGHELPLADLGAPFDTRGGCLYLVGMMPTASRSFHVRHSPSSPPGSCVMSLVRISS